jgi:CTD small phosphatase-like protein 2|eukprot:CAMPEP_0174285960 /NCGR_PEP_ID=MMETSP0809-20121228/10130_1 /TAXON_ID=73025 ORGANISM="Eutreptiella gymnastica-like, Strain CCMP1594" /NCGR_SAMPLE_ID=MMETSP0809 /ASSEMBLY_ACC=CAM_ASM_000658 /LENGTH=363 /DNA_ID=CAMNT_0015381855 /DNA_START=131 /DNA_END=1222 /DNA_ORIENTATION=+
MTIASPTKKVRPIPHSITPRTPTHSITPRTPTKPTEGFITSSPHSGKKSVSKLEIKKKQHSVKLRPPRTPSGTLFSPTYPPAVGANEFHQLEPSTPTTADVTLSPVQKSLQENVAKYSHLPQEFDEYDCDDFNPYGFIASLPPLTPASASPPCLPPKHPNAPPTTLVLDLDETLVHCSTDPSEVRNPDFVFHVEFHGTVYTVNALKRPGLHEFLEYIKDKFEVIIFTASQRVYANKLLDILDPLHEAIHHRVFRDDCTNVEGNYLKDLTVLGRDLDKTLIVDNSPQAFAFQLDNGVPILSWFERKSDRELFKIIPLLEQMRTAPQVQPILREKFQLYQKVEAKRKRLSGELESFEQRLLAESV